MDIHKDYYAILGVAADATPMDIKAAYRRRAKRYHPDTTALDPRRAQTRFSELTEAYRVLINPQTRRAYDVRRRAIQANRPQTLRFDLDVKMADDGFSDLEIEALATAALYERG
jgi:curved DNA-binding protein CbpA